MCGVVINSYDFDKTQLNEYRANRRRWFLVFLREICIETCNIEMFKCDFYRNKCSAEVFIRIITDSDYFEILDDVSIVSYCYSTPIYRS